MANFFKKIENEKGFTIIEIVVSIFILAIALIGIFSALSIVVILTSDSVDRLTANYLSQEGMEIVRNKRDTNWLKIRNDSAAGYTWTDGFSNCLSGCEADYTTTGSFPSASNNYLNLKNDFYVYDASNSSPTKFQRKITISPVTDIDGKSDHIIKVIVEVSWNKKATLLEPAIMAGTGDCPGSNCVIAEETLYNWYK